MRHVLILLAMLLFCNLVIAADITLAWDASESDGVLGYYLYIGNASRVYQQNVDVGDQLTYQIVGMTEGRWFFTVKAYGTDARESNYSNEVFVVINQDGSIDRILPPILQGGVI